MKPIKTLINFNKSGYYFFGLVVLVLLGFWPSYFSGFFNKSAKFSFIFHFHAIMMFLWILMLIVQPILIQSKKFSVHKFIGKTSYFLMPFLFASVILMVHSRINGKINDSVGFQLFVAFKDLLIIGLCYGIAIRYRHKTNIHARAMVCTGIVFIEPSLIRLLNHTLSKENQSFAYLLTITTIYLLLISIMIFERNQKNGRWIFPFVFIIYIVSHSILFFQISIPIWESFARWFIALPLTN